MSTSFKREARSLALHRLAVEKVRNNPALIEQVQSTLTRWRCIVDQRSQPYLIQWEAVIARGMDEYLEVAVEESDRGIVLRKSSPLAGILTNEERASFLRQWAAMT
jgi:hypothetical protein